MAEDQRYDAILIGAARGTVKLVPALAGAGWRVALVERKHLGGTCVNEGCMPTKTMVASARVAYLAGRAGDYGVNTGPVSVDLGKVQIRKKMVVDAFTKKAQGMIDTAAGVDLIMGEASFTSPTSVEVSLNDGSVASLAAERILIDTGARPVTPPVPGLESVPFLDSTSILDLDEIPEHLLVLGGSYIGLEFGQMFRRFGSRVTILQRGPQLMSREDPDVAAAIAEVLKDDGIGLHLGVGVTSVVEADDSQLQVTIETDGGEETLAGSHLLVAAGRAPNSERLNLPAAGVETDERGYIKVNDRLETNVPGIFALGDVKGGPAFTHISNDDSRIMARNLVGDGRGSTTGRPVPYTMFTDPELARIGLSESEARTRGLDVKIARLPMRQVDRALEMGETRGFMKAIVDTDTQQILGASILGVQAGETISILQVAMMGELPFTALRDAVFSHPTIGESLNDLFMNVEDIQSASA
jgi:pyruvate/2-oxoglutarate dehydrogenase complex dihydrolipoamide dehydrogenase (E3) component